MRVLQVTLIERDGRVSGAELRNAANQSALLAQFDVDRIDLMVAGSGAPQPSLTNVRALEAGEIARLLETVRSRMPDAVLIEGVVLLDAATALKQAFPDLAIIADCHNVESQLLAQMLAARFPPGLRQIGMLGYRRRLAGARLADAHFLDLASAVWVCSHSDAAHVSRTIAADAVTVVPNPIPAWCASARPATHPRAASTVLYVGNLGYAPNVNALAELCRVIMPRLHHHRPDARLHIAGGRASARLLRMAKRSGAALTLNPADLAPIYGAATVTAIPLRQGGGTRIKVIEALAVNCPIVATEKAVEGLGLVAGQHYLRADSADDFVRQLHAVFESDDLRAALCSAGQAHVQAHFGDARRAETVRASLARLR